MGRFKGPTQRFGEILLIFLFLQIITFFTQENNILKFSGESRMSEIPWPFKLFYNPNMKISKPGDTEKCRLCKYNTRNVESNSTPRDLIISVCFSRPQSLVVFAETLRTTGAKCRCVILTNEVAMKKISEKTKLILKNCDIQLISIGNTPDYKENDMHTLGFSYVHEFLQINKDEINRVAVIDLFDTVFQGDPFTNYICNDVLSVADEGSTFGQSWNGDLVRKWSEAYGFELTFVQREEELYLSSSYMSGSVNNVCTALKMIYFYSPFRKGLINSGGLNYIVYTNKLKDHGVSINMPREIEYVRNIAFGRLRNEKSTIGDVNTVRDSDYFAKIIHSYHFNDQLKKSILRACPREYPDLENYLYKCDENCIKKLEKELNLTK